MAVADATSLSIRRVLRADDQLSLVVTGVLAMGTAHELEAALADELAEHARILLDLGEVTFMDSCGIRVIMRALKLAQSHGWDFAIRDTMPDQVRRLLHVTGIGPFLPLAA